MDYWAKAPLGRDQTLLFYPALDRQIPADHPVRLLDEVLHQMDWSAWEGEYNGRIGQPPIPPRRIANPAPRHDRAQHIAWPNFQRESPTCRESCNAVIMGG